VLFLNHETCPDETKFNFLSLWMKYQRVTIQVKAIEQYFHVVLFIMLYNMPGSSFQFCG